MSLITSHKRPFTPARLLVDLNFAAKVWFGLFLLMAFCEAATLVLLLRPKRLDDRQILFVAATGIVYGGEEVDFSTITNLHVRAAEDATLVFFNRNPTDFDQPERVSLLFLPEAARDARSDCEQESAYRTARQLHQMAKITRLQYLEASNDRILFTVQGQLIQAGAFNNQPLVSAMPFQLDLELVRNPNLTLSAAFPLVVKRFLRYENPAH